MPTARNALLVGLLLAHELDRLESNCAVRSDGCLVWVGGRQSKGYGQTFIGGARRLVHRIAWELRRGPIPDLLTIDHTCGTKTCIRVDHLEVVSRSENARRRWSRQGGAL